MSNEISDNVYYGIECKIQYIKDISFENPFAPFSFLQNTTPAVNIDVNVAVRNLEEKNFEVILSTTVNAKDQNDQVVMLVSVDYAGVFDLKDVPEELHKQALVTYCPTLLFPYVRSLVSKLTSEGGFPPLFLKSFDFSNLVNQTETNLPN